MLDKRLEGRVHFGHDRRPIAHARLPKKSYHARIPRRIATLCQRAPIRFVLRQEDPAGFAQHVGQMRDGGIDADDYQQAMAR